MYDALRKYYLTYTAFPNPMGSHRANNAALPIEGCIVNKIGPDEHLQVYQDMIYHGILEVRTASTRTVPTVILGPIVHIIPIMIKLMGTREYKNAKKHSCWLSP
jgi:hypothetical protein